MKMMAMILFMLLPILGLAYVGWHVWTLVPLPAGWRVGLVVLGVLSFLSLFLAVTRVIDGWPMWLARLLSENGIFSSSFSKYGTYYKQLLLHKEPFGVYKKEVLSCA